MNPPPSSRSGKAGSKAGSVKPVRVKRKQRYWRDVSDHLGKIAKKQKQVNGKTNWKAVAHEIKEELLTAKIEEKVGSNENAMEAVNEARREVDDLFRTIVESDDVNDTAWHRRRKWERISRRLSEKYSDMKEKRNS